MLRVLTNQRLELPGPDEGLHHQDPVIGHRVAGALHIALRHVLPVSVSRMSGGKYSITEAVPGCVVQGCHFVRTLPIHNDLIGLQQFLNYAQVGISTRFLLSSSINSIVEYSSYLQA